MDKKKERNGGRTEASILYGAASGRWSWCSGFDVVRGRSYLGIWTTENPGDLHMCEDPIRETPRSKESNRR